LTGTEWGASAIIDTSTASKWVARSVIASSTKPTEEVKNAAVTSPYTPPIIVSRASIAKAIYESKYGSGDTSTKYEHTQRECDNNDCDEWVEVRGKSYTGTKKRTETYFADYEHNYYVDGGDFTGEEDSSNS